MKENISKIRELTNKRILKSILLKNQKSWNLMCGSLDAIESTQMAVDSFSSFKDDIKDFGLDNLIIYGLFQALYVQQDSISNLCESIGIEFPKFKDAEFENKYPELYKVRQLRNKGIGHPSRDRSNNTHSIINEDDSIQLFSFTENGIFSKKFYNISDCIEKQNHSLCLLLQQVIEKMISIEQEHKDKYMQNKFIGCFPEDSQYCIGKIFEAINIIDAKKTKESEGQRIGRESKIDLALHHIETLTKAIHNFQEGFKERGIEDISINHEIRDSLYPLEKLEGYFSKKSENNMNSQDARAYADSAEVHVLKLLEYARGIDDEYLK